jgi:Ser/Thr protein kinase RdoA (MazF antagonist)
VPDGPPAAVLAVFGAGRHQVTGLSDVPDGNANWLISGDSGPLVLRRHHAEATPAGLAWEHTVLRRLAGAGWTVPEPLGELTEYQGHWYGLNRYVPGQPARPEGPGEQAQRGRTLARLHLALRDLGDRIGPRPGWRPQHTHTTVLTGLDWDASVRALALSSPRLAGWAAAAAAGIRDALDAAGANALPVTVVHGDFAEWNMHYTGGRLTGVIDFELAHLDSRPFELAMARTYRAPGGGRRLPGRAGPARLAAQPAGRVRGRAGLPGCPGRAGRLADGAGAPHRAVRPGRHRAAAVPVRDPAALNWSYGVRVAAVRRRERAEDESEAGTRRLALPRPWGGMLP